MTHVLVVSHDAVGRHMAGPGIRYRELARVLARHFEVTLAIPCAVEEEEEGLDFWPYERSCWSSLAPVTGWADVIVACGDTLADFPALTQLPAPLVVDGYDPHTLETLALWAGEPAGVQAARYGQRLDVLRRQCQAGDLFICASERQRDWWLGQLEQQGRINPLTFADDPSLRRLIDVVPSGLPAQPPVAERPVLRGVWPGLDAGDQILLWGGGLWQWLDPLTALRAVRRLVDAGLDRVRLVFPGTRHPNPDLPDMPMRAQALALAGELGLTGRYAFFGDWVAHQDWPAVLLEADIGLSLHPDTVETRLSVRSRVLDYVWAGLPMVVTRGDAASELVRDHGLGLVVGYEDDEAVAGALQALLAEPRSARQDRFARARADMTWERAARPLVAFCRQPRRAADRRGDRPGSQEPPGREASRLLAEREREIARLQGSISAFERDPLLRLSRQARHGWQRLLNSRLVRSWLDALHTERFYRQLARQVGTASSHAFVDQAYWHILRRAPDPDGFDHFTSLLAQGQGSRREVVVRLVRSVEFHRRPRPKLGLVETLHLVRCQLVRNLPPADHILDLGGAAPNSIQGSLLVMGYPHHVRSLTIVDLPPADRLGHYARGDTEGQSGWIETEMGPVRYLHTSMNCLSEIEDESMDLVFAGQSIEHVSEEAGRQTMREVRRVLRPGGYFCLDTPNARLTRLQSPRGFLHPEHQIEYEVGQLVARLEATGFVIRQVQGLCPMPNTVQTGVFQEQELFDNPVLSDRAEICYLFFVECVKPDGE